MALFDGTPDIASGNDATVTIDNPAAGVWYIGIYNSGTNKVDNEDVSASALNFIEQTPLRSDNTRREQSAELTNFATWYSYYRTRIKTAKGGASESFASLGKNYRIGFSAINSVDSTDNIIPIDAVSKGEFAGGNKASFFTSLQGAGTGSGQTTPLRPALKSVGEYFKRADAAGPWGPGSGNEQFSCRQNFAILTTDGYWTSGANGFGNEDKDAGRPYADTSSDTLADVAYHYWKTDLRTDMADNVPTSVDDGNNAAQHMNTFTVSIGVEGKLKASDLPDLEAGRKSWPSLSSSNNGEIPEKIDDLWHAAINGHADFVVANNPSEFTAALNAALATINGRTSSYSNVATNSVSLDTGANVFNASYTSGSWVGALTASAVSGTGVGVEKWKAKIPAVRMIKTAPASGSGAALDDFPNTNQVATFAALGGTDVTNYIKGDQAKEKSRGGNFRTRDSLLGDIVGSSPAYVKDTDTLYVGANDGMLHAFDASNGNEVFAYVPTGINWADLASLSSPTYTHRFFVDGPIAVSSRTLTAGKNILVGALGKGGKGLYALNVFSPSSPAFAWELKETPGSNMGLVMGKPLIAKVPGGKTAAIVGNGVNSSKDRAVLVVVSGIDEASQTVVEIDTGEGSSVSPNGLSAPAGVYGPDGKTLAYVYAGDMLGNVWKFDLKTNKATKLFAAGAKQPISGGVTIAADQKTNNRWVFFGTGRYLIAGDASSTGADTQSMYGFIDDGSGTIVKRSELTARTLSVTSGTSNGYPVRAFQKKEALPAGSKGWYIDLPVAGERIVQDAQVVSTFLITASMIPNSGSDPCKPDGSGFINALDAFTGTSAAGSYFDLDGKPATADEINGYPVGSVDVKNGMPTLPSLLRGLMVVGGTGGAGLSSPKTLSPRWDRVSWREVRSD
jgi:type IV pilus assembly protein PilY1